MAIHTRGRHSIKFPEHVIVQLCPAGAALRNFALLAAALLASCGGSGQSATEGPAPPPADVPPVTSAVVAFVGVDVVPMDSEILLIDQTVVVRDRRITSVGLRSDIAIPDDAEQIDGKGLVLMPGLADMHVHLAEEDLPGYLASGITTVRNMWGHSAVRDMMERIATGELPGPMVYSTSPGIDGPPAKWPVTQIVESAAEAQQTVARLVGDGWTMLKVYQDLRPDVYSAVVEAAREHGVPFMGHVPHRVGLRDALLAGQFSLEHLGGYDIELGGTRGTAGWLKMNTARIPDVVMWTWEAGAYVCPTLVVVKALAQRNHSSDDARVVAENRRLLVSALHQGYVPLLLGTDSGIDIVAPGSSLHEELLEFRRAGLSPYSALAAATVVAAEFLGEVDEFGAVREGLRADLLLLEQNPLEDVRASSDPVGIMVNGDWYFGDALETLLRQAASR
ncbi:MAG TPA: amidohydrolase family protein [Gammaproteobacteria bacterium]|nr:amidohydrolase family protein [Gammaproteobacteria bacterium]